MDLFQSGGLDILICSFGVGSTGLTLTRSSRLILLDRPWTPGDAKQAEDRIRRIGQHAQEVQSIWIAGFSFDDSLDKLLQKKDRNSLRVIEIPDSNFVLGSRTSSWFSLSPEAVGETVRGKNTDIRAYLKGGKSSTSISSGDADTPAQSSRARQWWEVGEEEDDGHSQEIENTDPETSQSKTMMTVLREILM